VNDTALRAAVAGTNLTFTLYTDASCTQQVFQQVVPIETVALVSRLKTFTPRNAPRGPKIDEVHETLTGVSAAGTLYLTVTGTGINPVGGACQAQATVQASGAVVKDANGSILGVNGSSVEVNDTSIPDGIYWVAYRNVGGQTVGIYYRGPGYTFPVVYPTTDCSGQPYVLTPSIVDPYPIGTVSGTTLFYAIASSQGLNVSSERDIFGDCFPYASPQGMAVAPAATASGPVPVFTPPFHVEVP
jgi:hypothetical protein